MADTFRRRELKSDNDDAPTELSVSYAGRSKTSTTYLNLRFRWWLWRSSSLRAIVADSPISRPYISTGDLISHGVLSCPGMQPNNLANPVHPLLAFSQWQDITVGTYHLILPSLRLASRFLTSQGSVNSFFATALFGTRDTDVPASIRRGQTTKRILFHEVGTEAHHKLFIDRLLSMAAKKSLTFSFGYSPNSDTCGISDLAEMECQFGNDAPYHSGKRSFGFQHITIHWSYLRFVVNELETNRACHGTRLSFNMLLAIKLLHELTHVVLASADWDEITSSSPETVDHLFNVFRQGPRIGVKTDQNKVVHIIVPPRVRVQTMEPYFLESDGLELGKACEKYVFGHSIEALGHIMDRSSPGLRGLMYLDRSYEVGSFISIQKYATIPISWVSKLQQEQTWQDLSPEGTTRLLRAPQSQLTFWNIDTKAHLSSLCVSEWIEDDKRIFTLKCVFWAMVWYFYWFFCRCIWSLFPGNFWSRLRFSKP